MPRQLPLIQGRQLGRFSWRKSVDREAAGLGWASLQLSTNFWVTESWLEDAAKTSLPRTPPWGSGWFTQMGCRKRKRLLARRKASFTPSLRSSPDRTITEPWGLRRGSSLLHTAGATSLSQRGGQVKQATTTTKQCEAVMVGS